MCGAAIAMIRTAFSESLRVTPFVRNVTAKMNTTHTTIICTKQKVKPAIHFITKGARKSKLVPVHFAAIATCPEIILWV